MMITSLLCVGLISGCLTADKSILVFTKTAGFRHDSILVGKNALLNLPHEGKWNIVFSEDGTLFSDRGLRAFDVVVFLSTTGDILNDQQQKTFQQFIERGGGFVGIHAAADTEYDWPWYGKLVGAYFESHPEIQRATIRVEDPNHPTASFLPKEWVRTDEWYNYRANPRPIVHVIATLDESTYKGGKMGSDHPIIWCHEIGKGRAWYTGLGHTAESYSEPMFLKSIAAAIEWVSAKR